MYRRFFQPFRSVSRSLLLTQSGLRDAASRPMPVGADGFGAWLLSQAGSLDPSLEVDV
jgi:hypothetical protein